MNTLKDLLFDLACEAVNLGRGNVDPEGKTAEDLSEEYLQRFKEENSKYFEWEAK